jgi:dCMP deaminase
VQASDVPSFPHLVREIRSLDLKELAVCLAPLGYKVLPFSDFHENQFPHETQIYVPEDDVTRSLSFTREVIWGSAFLRWDWSKSSAVGFVQPEADRVVRKGDPEYAHCSICMQNLLRLARRSSDWWRQVGAMAITSDNVCLVAYNKHYPHEYVPYMDGDPRDSFKPGEFIEVTSALHGEQALIAEAAKRGISLEGAELYVTTFPCNLCAPPVVVAGFRKVFFTGGYSNLNGQKTLRSHGVELIYVEL